MRIYAVTPIHVDAGELARRQARYDALCPPGLTVRLYDIGERAPRALNTEDEVRSSEAFVVEALNDAPAEYDALMPDCVLDPGVAMLAHTAARPVLGLLRISLGWSVCTGRTTGAVARNSAIADEMVRVVETYGWGDLFTGVEVLDLGVDAIADSAAWNHAVEAAQRRLGEAGSSVVVNGCSAVDVTTARAGSTPRLVDPTALALRLVAAGEVA